jgi:hypothetical protein
VDGICIGTPTPRLVLVVAATRRSASEEYNVAMSQQLLYLMERDDQKRGPNGIPNNVRLYAYLCCLSRLYHSVASATAVGHLLATACFAHIRARASSLARRVTAKAFLTTTLSSKALSTYQYSS